MAPIRFSERRFNLRTEMTSPRYIAPWVLEACSMQFRFYSLRLESKTGNGIPGTLTLSRRDLFSGLGVGW